MLSNTLILQWHEDVNTVPKRYLLYSIVSMTRYSMLLISYSDRITHISYKAFDDFILHIVVELRKKLWKG
jgi:hypothetical protein